MYYEQWEEPIGYDLTATCTLVSEPNRDILYGHAVDPEPDYIIRATLTLPCDSQDPESERLHPAIHNPHKDVLGCSLSSEWGSLVLNDTQPLKRSRSLWFRFKSPAAALGRARSALSAALDVVRDLAESYGELMRKRASWCAHQDAEVAYIMNMRGLVPPEKPQSQEDTPCSP